MTEIFRRLLEIWIVRHTSETELRRAKLESLAREFLPSSTGATAEQRIRDAFKLGRVWIEELEVKA